MIIFSNIVIFQDPIPSTHEEILASGSNDHRASSTGTIIYCEESPCTTPMSLKDEDRYNGGNPTEAMKESSFSLFSPTKFSTDRQRRDDDYCEPKPKRPRRRVFETVDDDDLATNIVQLVQSSNMKFEKRIKDLQESNELLQDEKHSLQDTITRMEKSHSEKIQSFEQRLRSANNDLKKNQKTLETTKQQVNILRAKIQTLENEKREAEERTKQAELSTVRLPLHFCNNAEIFVN